MEAVKMDGCRRDRKSDEPYATAFCPRHQHEIDIPIFSWGTLLDYVYSVVVHRDYYGHV